MLALLHLQTTGHKFSTMEMLSWWPMVYSVRTRVLAAYEIALNRSSAML